MEKISESNKLFHKFINIGTNKTILYITGSFLLIIVIFTIFVKKLIM